MKGRVSSERGWRQGFRLPDYQGGSLLNVLASVIRARGGASLHPGARVLDEASLHAARKVVLLVIDGLGAGQLDDYLKRYPQSPFFAQQTFHRITTVFPATTATAITTLATGCSPAEHGILGWFINQHDMGGVCAVLRSCSRNGQPWYPDEFSLKRYLAMPGYLRSMKGRRTALIVDRLAHTAYSKATSQWTAGPSFRTLTGMRRAVTRELARSGRAAIYAYWAKYDTLVHRNGVGHKDVLSHLAELDRTLALLEPAVRTAGATLLVTADHGLVDARPGGVVDLRDVPGLYACLSVLPCGDPRAVACYVRPGKVRAFKMIVERYLAGKAVCVRGETLLRTGLFGPGQPHPSLEAHVGDYYLLARDGVHLNGSPAVVESDVKVAHHGGLSPAEMEVPLLMVRGPT